MEKKYQIFISSTFEDLKDARREIIQATLVMGHIPVGMELFSAADEEQWKLIAERINECDYYVVIVAHRYGSMTQDGISYTQKEYRYAQSRQVPTLRFVIAKDAPWPSEWCESDRERVSLLDSFKQELSTKWVDPWNSPEDLGGKYSRALPRLTRDHRRDGWIPGSVLSGPDVLGTIVRYSQENAKLRDELARFRKAQTIDADKMLKVLGKQAFRFHTRANKQEGWSEEVREMDGWTLLQSIAPTLLVDGCQYASTISQHIALAVGVRPETDHPIPTNQLMDILAKLSTYGIIEPVQGTGLEFRLWALTGLGEELYKHRVMQDLFVEAHTELISESSPESHTNTD